MRALFYAAQFIGLAAWLAFCFLKAWQGGDLWVAVFSFGLGAFMAQVAISLVLIKSSEDTPIHVSELQRRLSQFFVLLAAVGFFGVMINRYVIN